MREEAVVITFGELPYHFPERTGETMKYVSQGSWLY
jgi:hypothetical protein